MPEELKHQLRRQLALRRALGADRACKATHQARDAALCDYDEAVRANDRAIQAADKAWARYCKVLKEAAHN